MGLEQDAGSRLEADQGRQVFTDGNGDGDGDGGNAKQLRGADAAELMMRVAASAERTANMCEDASSRTGNGKNVEFKSTSNSERDDNRNKATMPWEQNATGMQRVLSDCWGNAGVDSGIRGSILRTELGRGGLETSLAIAAMTEAQRRLAYGDALKMDVANIRAAEKRLAEKDCKVSELSAVEREMLVYDDERTESQVGFGEDVEKKLDDMLLELCKDREAVKKAQVEEQTKRATAAAKAQQQQQSFQPQKRDIGDTSLTELLQRPGIDNDELGATARSGRISAPPSRPGFTTMGFNNGQSHGNHANNSNSFGSRGINGDDGDGDAGNCGRARRGGRRPQPAAWARAPPGASHQAYPQRPQNDLYDQHGEDDFGQGEDENAETGFVSALSKLQQNNARRGVPFKRPGAPTQISRRVNSDDDDSSMNGYGGKPMKRRRGFRPPARVDENTGPGQQGGRRLPSGGGGASGAPGGRLGGRPGGAGGGGPTFNAGKAIKRALADQANDQNGGDGAANGQEGGLPQEYLDEPRLRGLDPALIERIESEVLQTGDPVTFDDIAGLRFAKENIEEIVVWPLRNPEYYTGLRQLPKGLLLFGPPGTGKTLIGKAIAHEVNATFFSISASSLTSKWIGEGEKTVRALFGVAAVKQPSVVFIDEVDSLLTQRTADENESSRRIKTEFLVQLDGAATSSGERVLVIGATNRPQELDEAARRRFIKRLYIPLPDDVTRLALLRKLLSKNEHSITEEEISSLCTQTEGYSGADVTNLAREASMGPLRDKMRHRRQADDPDAVSGKLRPICFQDFRVALRSIRASVSQEDLRFYIKWNDEFGTQEYAPPAQGEAV